MTPQVRRGRWCARRRVGGAVHLDGVAAHADLANVWIIGRYNHIARGNLWVSKHIFDVVDGPAGDARLFKDCEPFMPGSGSKSLFNLYFELAHVVAACCV